MTIFKIKRGEACSNYHSDFADWNVSEYVINLETITLEERRHEIPNGYSTSFYVHGPGLDIEVKEGTFKRIQAAIEAL